MLIATHYLLLKNWDIFATRCCILLIFNHNYFRGGEVKTTFYNNNPCGRKITRIFLFTQLTYINLRLLSNYYFFCIFAIKSSINRTN